MDLELRTDRRLPEPVEVAAYYVVSEALTNAGKHSQASVINVEVATDDAVLRLSVSDDGVGGADESHGSGLIGLHDRIESLGGTLEITSTPGNGTSILAKIPIDGHDEAMTYPPHEATAEPAVRIALADDDVLLREGMASLLEQHGFEVIGQAGDATELLQLVREQEPDFVIVDIRMPPAHSTEGLEAARVIRREFPDVAILVLSAHVEVYDAMELLAGGERIGYVLKNRVTHVDEFVDTLLRIAREEDRSWTRA